MGLIRTIIFDWSGTLVDDLPAVWEASNHVFRLAKVPEMSMDTFRREFCLPFKNFYDRIIPHVALSQLEVWYHELMKDLPHTVEPLPHAREFLEACRARGIRTILLSSVNRLHFADQVRRSGFGPYLDHCHVEAHDKRLIVPELMKRYALAADETLFIGDMQHDVEAAQAGGIHSCAVLTGYNHLHQLQAANPERIVEHLGELLRMLESNDWHYPAPAGPLIPVATVGALIWNQDRVLMIRTHKWSDMWGIPGGKIQGGETAEAALHREVMEETALEIERIEWMLVQDCIRSKEFYREAHFVLLNYSCHTHQTEVVLNEEAEEFRWVTMEEAFKLPLNQPTLVLLQAYLKRKSEGIAGS